MSDGSSDEAWASIDRWVELQRIWWENALRAHQILGSQPAAALEEAHRRSVDAWTDAQRRAWLSWLAIAHGYEPGAQDAGAAMAEALREAAERLVESQADWARAWNEQNPGPQGDDKA